MQELQSLLAGDNAHLIDAQYQLWLEDASLVDPEWADVFAQWERPGPTPMGSPVFPRTTIFREHASSAGRDLRFERKQAKVAQLINAFRVWGHKQAKIDPLGQRATEHHPELTLAYWGLSDEDLDATFPSSPLSGLPEFAPLRQILGLCRAAYSDLLGAEFMNIPNVEQKQWVQQRLEQLPSKEVLNSQEERRVLRKMNDAEHFERLLHQRFPGTKRFSLEGGETLIPLMDILVEHASELGVNEIVIGMAHRGRLNVLANIMQKPVEVILGEFEKIAVDAFQGSGDVKYHVGYSSDAVTSSGKNMHLSLTPNPSHLEAVNPVVEGRVRAKQDRDTEGDRRGVMGVLIHGDAAFAGQGVVAETLQLSELPAYRTEGTIHIIVNNQIGFTTGADEARSTPYATGMARMLGVPIYHVNGESPRAVGAAVKMAVEWRQRFQRDVVIDMYCFRKHGHNEGDEPAFTQPELYGLIRKRPTPRVVYERHLVNIGYMTEDEVESISVESRTRMESALFESQRMARISQRVSALTTKGTDPDLELYEAKGTTRVDTERKPVNVDAPRKGLWQYYVGNIRDEVDTTCALESLVQILEQANTPPAGFTPHPKVRRILQQRLDVVHGKRPVDWAVAEQAAYASLVSDGHPVRISGQDAGRGTFSHRHAILTAPDTGKRYIPLANLAPDQGRFEVWNSLLSEAAVLGFEYGYSLDCPEALVVWEAQFGDFANGAQILIDQFLVAAEQKWDRRSGLVMLLPHGMESQGPEHCSARLERYLQACAQDNIQVANCTTPANFYHLLRRQVLRRVRKPLVVLTPKSLLRSPKAVSSMDDLASGAFRHVIADPQPPADVQRIVLCSGKVYYDLVAERETIASSKVSLNRVEMLYPFPQQQIGEILASAPDAEVVWCQEEPKNFGAWMCLLHWFLDAFPERIPRYVGRAAAAAPSHGSSRVDKEQQARLVREALRLEGESS